MKKFFKDLFLGIGTSFKGLGFAFNNGMGHYLIYPLVITVALAWVGIETIEAGVNISREWLLGLMGLDMAQEALDDSWWEVTRAFISDAAGYLLTGILWLVYYFVLHKVIKYVTLILMSPIMALISEKTEEVLTGNTYPFEWNQFLKDIWRGVLIAIRNFFVETGIIVLLWIAQILITWVLPPVGFIAAPMVFVLNLGIGAYFWGFSTMDYTNERRRLSVGQSIRFIRNFKGLAIGNGLIFMLLIEIPFIGTYLGPVFATVMCTTGATLAIHERVNLGEQDFYLDATKKKSERGSSNDQALTNNE